MTIFFTAMYGGIVPVYIHVFNVSIYMNEFIETMDHMSYPPPLPRLSDTFSRRIWKRIMHLRNLPPLKYVASEMYYNYTRIKNIDIAILYI